MNTSLNVYHQNIMSYITPYSDYSESAQPKRQTIYSLRSGIIPPHMQFPMQLSLTKMVLTSGCKSIVYNETGIITRSDPCYQLQFHANIREGELMDLDIVVTRSFKTPIRDPLNGVQLDIGMTVQATGSLTAHYIQGKHRGVIAMFHLDAILLTRSYDLCTSAPTSLSRKNIGPFTC
ncbi:hypothetical protein BGX34_009632 [Mortierella sp. NVP85]|nr:hypothetical protein BGX34_009632 [Mortierella sp. NVP85]